MIWLDNTVFNKKESYQLHLSLSLQINKRPTRFRDMLKLLPI